MSGDDPAVRVVLVTAPDPACAERLARTLVEEKLLLVAKTRAERGGALAARVKELHPYDLPEVLELPAVGGSEAYLDWVRLESSS